MKIAIVGCGISGLATAFYIQQRHPNCSIALYESGEQAGGTMRTVDIDGFLFEAGGNGFLTNKTATLDLVNDCAAQHLLMRSNDAARKRYIYNGQLHPLPMTPPAFLATPLLSPSAKLRVISEIFRRPKQDHQDESLAQFGKRRLGQAFTKTFLDPMAAGVFGSTADKLSVQAAFPAVVALERDHGGLFLGMIKKKKSQTGPGGVLTSFKGGVSRFIDHLVRQIKAPIHLNCPVEQIDKTPQGYRLRTPQGQDDYDQVIISAPSWAAAKMLKSLDAALADSLSQIPYTPISVVGFGWKQAPHAFDGFGLLSTQAAQLEALGVLWDSSVFTDRAPEGGASVRLMIGGQRQPQLAQRAQQQLIDMAKGVLKQTLGIDQAPDVQFVQQWAQGIPSYEVGHLDRVTHIEQQLTAHPGLWLSNNAYHGVAINDCVANAKRCAAMI